MFHFAPRHRTAQLSPFDSLPYSAPSHYDAFDARRSHLEQLALAKRQQERREAEEALLRRRQQELAVEKEVERRRIAAYQAALEQQIYDQLEEERQWRAQQQAALREQHRRQALEEEHRRKILVACQQEEFLRRRQEQARRQQITERDQHQAQEDTDSLEAHLQPFLQLLFGSHPTSQPTSTTPASQSEPQAQSNAPTASATAEPTPASLPTPSPAAPAEEEPLADSTSTSAAEKLQAHYRTHLHRRQALSTLASLSSSLDTKQSAFALPSTLTFQPSPPSSTADDHTATSPSPTPKLAFQSTNAPFLAYEDFLVSLLSKIDAVSSGGDRTVKQSRKQLVKRVDAELSRLDEARETAWAKEQISKADEQELATSPTEEKQVDDTADADDLPPLLDSDSALPSPAAVEPSSSPSPVNVSSVSHSTSDDAPTPLTSTTLASVPSSPSVAEPSTPRPESAASSDAASDETLSVDESDVEAAISDIVRQAHKLGEEVVMLEKVELGRVEEAEEPAEDFVVV